METLEVNPKRLQFVYPCKQDWPARADMRLFSERVAERMRELQIRQVDIAAATKATKGAVSKWINHNAIPEVKYLIPLSRCLKVTPEWLTSGREPKEPTGIQFEPTRRVPIISSVTAGRWTANYSSEHLDSSTEYQVTTLNVSGEAFALRVQGDSMTNPYASPSIPEGSIVIVEPHPAPDSGRIVVAMLDGSDEATIKRLQVDGPNRYLVPLNPKYSTIPINGNCRIVGYVRQVIQNL
ncbi:SOS-response transcriptional repressor LexA [Oceanisphaera litoralis]|uniref:S24 family peptidase n=1 Tax=Oceanisphaera litoralis TaxID=225144 RepID=UPI001957C23C|nr:SOS-response transcriptional repressor LexA [Oceanisphaera litoralis]